MCVYSGSSCPTTTTTTKSHIYYAMRLWRKCIINPLNGQQKGDSTDPYITYYTFLSLYISFIIWFTLGADRKIHFNEAKIKFGRRFLLHFYALCCEWEKRKSFVVAIFDVFVIPCAWGCVCVWHMMMRWMSTWAGCHNLPAPRKLPEGWKDLRIRKWNRNFHKQTSNKQRKKMR